MDSPTSEVLLLSEDDSGLLVNGSFSNSSASSNSNKHSPQFKVGIFILSVLCMSVFATRFKQNLNDECFVFIIKKYQFKPVN